MESQNFLTFLDQIS